MSSREIMDPHKGDKRYSQCQGQFTEQHTKGNSTLPQGQGGRGDEKRI